MKLPKIKTTLPANFYEIERPKFADTLKFPDDITQLTAQNVSDLHAKYTMLYTYANQELAKTNVSILRLQMEESFLRNDIFRKRPSINMQERWKRDTVIDADPKIENVQRQLVRFRQIKELTQSMVTNFDKFINALSRELSRKSSEQR